MTRNHEPRQAVEEMEALVKSSQLSAIENALRLFETCSAAEVRAAHSNLSVRRREVADEDRATEVCRGVLAVQLAILDSSR